MPRTRSSLLFPIAQRLLTHLLPAFVRDLYDLNRTGLFFGIARNARIGRRKIAFDGLGNIPPRMEDEQVDIRSFLLFVSFRGNCFRGSRLHTRAASRWAKRRSLS
jgi:hypothetical protein